MNHNLTIKNMVCPRCITVVQHIFEELHIAVIEVTLGRVITIEPLMSSQKLQLEYILKTNGFELLDDKQSQIINQIKSILIQHIHYLPQAINTNFSTLLKDQLHFDYTYLSKIFSTVEGQTIERFILAQKIEKVKELLTYDEMTISEIAYQLHYSSPAHLSTQFKKITGMSPSAFKKLQYQERQFLDKL